MSETPVTGFPDPEPISPADPREAAIEALLRLAAERDWAAISLQDVARAANLSLGELRGLFPSKGAILSAFSRRIDQAVLAGSDASMTAEPPRDRLFDVLMRRLDALQTYKVALRRIARAMAADPLSLAALNKVVVTSMQWMLAAADLPSDGPRGAGQAQGLAIAWTQILKVWFDDDPEGARTMTEVDRQLRRGEQVMRRVDDLCRMTAPLRRFVDRTAHSGFGARARPDIDPERGGAEAI